MRSYSKISTFTLAALCLTACGQKAVIEGNLKNGADQQIIVKQLDVNVYNVLDTIKTASDGSFKYEISVAKGEPEFVYLFHGDKRIAALLLEQGEKVRVETDTLGNYSSDGSEGSDKLEIVDKAYTKFMNDLYEAREDAPRMAKIYLDHYRANVRYILENPYSLTCIPVLYESMSDVSPVFSQHTDALFFKNAADSLKTVYPESRYVKALEKEAQRRLQLLNVDTYIKNAEQTSYPDISLPDMKGEKKALSSIEAKAILIHFWDADDAAQKMMNLELLLPLYEKYHSRGLEIYAVCTSWDKALWGSVVSSQKLPWINVCDGLGRTSPAITLYNITSTPTSILIENGELSSAKLSDEASLRKELDRILRR